MRKKDGNRAFSYDHIVIPEKRKARFRQEKNGKQKSAAQNPPQRRTPAQPAGFST